MERDGARVVHHLTRLAHVGGAKIQDNVWKNHNAEAILFN